MNNTAHLHHLIFLNPMLILFIPTKFLLSHTKLLYLMNHTLELYTVNVKSVLCFPQTHIYCIFDIME